MKFTIPTFILSVLALTAGGLAASQNAATEKLLADAGPVAQAVVPDSVAVAEPAAQEVGYNAPYELSVALAPPWGDSRAALVITQKQVKEQDIADMTEDMIVMSRIFDKNLGRQRADSRFRHIYGETLNVYGHLAGGTCLTEALYLEGFGVLFLTETDFPLAAPREVKRTKIDPNIDQVWEQEKRGMYGWRQPGSALDRMLLTSDVAGQHEKQEYRAEKVEELKKTLTKTLRHAANIRLLKPDEWVSVVARGPEAGAYVSNADAKVALTEAVEPSAQRSLAIAADISPETAALSPTFLTIRAKKSDIDGFSKNQLDYEQFRKRVAVLTY